MCEKKKGGGIFSDFTYFPCCFRVAPPPLPPIFPTFVSRALNGKRPACFPFFFFLPWLRVFRSKKRWLHKNNVERSVQVQKTAKQMRSLKRLTAVQRRCRSTHSWAGLGTCDCFHFSLLWRETRKVKRGFFFFLEKAP